MLPASGSSLRLGASFSLISVTFAKKTNSSSTINQLSPIELPALKSRGRPHLSRCLSQREVEVLQLIAYGKINSEIAEELVIAEGTARRHVANIYEKIGAANRVEAGLYAAQHGHSE